MTAILNHLLRRSPLLSHESLHSFIERLVISNHFHTTAQLTGLLNCVGYRYPQIGIFTESEDYARLSHLSDVPEIDLYKASIHRFSKLILSNTERLSHISIPGGQDIPIIDTKKIHKRFRDPSSAQYCPECLREEPYHRVDWFAISGFCLPNAGNAESRSPSARSSVIAVNNAVGSYQILLPKLLRMMK
jgi:hypothetical protein